MIAARIQKSASAQSWPRRTIMIAAIPVTVPMTKRARRIGISRRATTVFYSW